MVKNIIGLLEHVLDAVALEIAVVVAVEVADAGHHELILLKRGQHGQHDVQHFLDFLLARARQHGNNLLVGVEAVALVKIGRGLELGHGVGGGVAGVVDLVVELLVEFRLEGQDGEHAVDMRLDLRHAALVPGPYFRRDIVEHLDAVGLGKFGHAHVEAGVVDQYQHVGLEVEQVSLALFQVAAKLEHAGSRLPEAHNGQVLVVAHQLAALLLHLVAAPVAKVGRRVLRAQLAHEVRRVEVARPFAGYEVVFHGLN